jgi:hypothetical protein
LRLARVSPGVTASAAAGQLSFDGIPDDGQ